jgi:ubiquinone/menaquinone biosynthesis C-methylase UbiE
MARSFDRVAAIYDATRQLPAAVEESIAAGIVRHTGATAATRFLEVGVGTGRIALPLLRRGHHLCGVDAAAAMLAAARLVLRGGPGQLDLVRGDALALPFAPATFDVGLVVHIFHLLPDWRDALDELLRVIQPGGYFLYGSEQPDEAAESDHFAEHWRAVLSRHGLTPRNHRATDAAVASTLRERGDLSTIETLARWQRRASVRQILERYASRDYSSSWSIPEPIFREANAELAAWATAHHPDPEQIIEQHFCFRVLTARRP